MNKNLLIEEEVNDEEGTKRFAKKSARYFQEGDSVLLYGALGSGKTFLIKQLVALLGSEAEVSSPSFSLINQYSGDILLNHVDLYRIKDETELINLGLEDLWNEKSINFIEWPEKIENRISWAHFRIDITTNVKNMCWRKFRLFEVYE
jgi:tRNA threonylcarbamoyladenosine biosynthesis protein TsaE